jgi:hypothetical protein
MEVKMQLRSQKDRTRYIFLTVLMLGCICSGCSSEVNYIPPDGSGEIAITHYSFGRIIVNGKPYENDIAIFADGRTVNWQAQANHAIQLADVKTLMDGGTTTLIIGIGAHSGCSVTDDIAAYAASKNIAVHVLDSFEAVKLFNASPKKGLAACFHVNC